MLALLAETTMAIPHLVNEKKGCKSKVAALLFSLERAAGFEPATLSLGSPSQGRDFNSLEHLGYRIVVKCGDPGALFTPQAHPTTSGLDKAEKLVYVKSNLALKLLIADADKKEYN
jgi:hypothetical protein